jgi:ubiquinone/menaquinone biosynthesis C-methylase UbiE
MASTFAAGNGAGYELQMGRWSRRLAPGFLDFVGIDSAANVLDVGCGTGNLTVALAERLRVATVLGVDLSPPYVAFARDRAGNPRIDFLVADACALPIDSASFDHALSLLVLQFIPHPERAVREMCRVTRPGGIIAAATWDSRGGLVAQRMILDTAALLDHGGSAHRARACTRPLSRPDELARTWCEAGLVDVVQQMMTIRMDFRSFADFWAPVEGRDGPVAEYVGALTAATRADLREMVRLAYVDGEEDGPRSYAATAWVVKGRMPD